MKKILSANIIFENSDSINITSNDILLININHIDMNIHIVFYKYSEYVTCQSCYLKLSNNLYNKTTAYTKNFFNRVLKYNDISNIQLFFTDGTNMSIYMPWKNSPENNNLQYTELDENNNLIIRIGKND